MSQTEARQRAVDKTIRFLEPAISEGLFSADIMAESEAWARSWPYWQAVADTGRSYAEFEAMQSELADKAETDPVWHKAAIFAGTFIIRQGLPIHPRLGRIIASAAVGDTPPRKVGRKSGDYYAHRDRYILHAVELLTERDPQDLTKFTQGDAFQIVADAIRQLKASPNSADGVSRRFWKARKARAAEVATLPDID